MQKKLLASLGSLVALIALGFVGQQLYNNWHKVGDYQFNLESICTLLLGAMLYSCACLLLSSAWYQILSALSSQPLSIKTLRSIYARSQIAKYIPGNVLQIAGRHLMIRRLGVAHKPLALASFIEIIGLLSASCSVTLIGSTLFGLGENYIQRQQLYYGLAAVAIVLLLLPIFRAISLKFIPASRNILSNPRLLRAFVRAYLEYLFFFMIAGAILVGLVYQLHGVLSIYNIAAIMASFSVSWFAGFITPRAPSGIGIRETILVVSLDKILLGGQGVLIAILFRIMTIGGDVLFFSLVGRTKS